MKPRARACVLERMRGALVIAVAVTGCAAAPGEPAPTTTVPAPVEAPAEPRCIGADPYTAGALRDRMDELAGVELEGRAPGTPGDRAARTRIAQRFACLGLHPGGDAGGFEQAFLADTAPTANVIGYVRGSDPALADQIVVVGAHHDHLGREGSHRYLGANDNASGVTALLAVAEAIQARSAPPRRTIVFAAFGGEEGGLLGSAYYVQHTPPQLPVDRVVQMVNLDMVGSYASRKVVFALGTFRGLPAQRLLGELDDAHPGLVVRTGGRGSGSDHVAFCARGIPYTFFWTPDGECYHETCDTIERIDFPHMTAIARLAGALVERLADTTLDLPEVRRKRGCGERGG